MLAPSIVGEIRSKHGMAWRRTKVSMHWFAHGLAFALVLPQVHSADVTTDGLWQLSGKHDSTCLFIRHPHLFGLGFELLHQAVCLCTVHERKEKRRGGSYPSLSGGLKRGSGVGASRR